MPISVPMFSADQVTRLNFGAINHRATVTVDGRAVTGAFLETRDHKARQASPVRKDRRASRAPRAFKALPVRKAASAHKASPVRKARREPVSRSPRSRC